MKDPGIDRAIWKRLAGLLDEALELPEREAAAFLDRACGADRELRSRAEALLRAEREAGSFLQSPAAEMAAELIPDGEDTEHLEGPLTPREGAVLGHYRLERRLGGGGMGVVFEAEDVRLGRKVALKLLPDAWSRDPGAKERFLREARAASALDHPNICTVHELGETGDGRLFLVMPRYRGETLGRRLKRGPLPPEEARNVIRQVARGLEQAHRAGIVHRDVKPANVMLAERGEVKVLDFGIAKVAGEAALTRTGSSMGTPSYMSPEQALGRAADARSDVWAVGALLYEMLSARRPFPGDDAQVVIYGILNREPEPLPRANLPEDLVRVAERSLSKEPHDRYADLGELLADLDPESLSGITPGSAEIPRPAGSRRRRWPLAAALAAALAAVSTWWWMARAGSPEGSRSLPATSPASTAVPAPAEPTSLAVLRFRNLREDAELDWLGNGIADMLVTDLSQSSGIRMLSSSTLAQAWQDLGVSAGTAPSLDLIQLLATRTGVSAVIRGSFARAGNALRIQLTVEDAASGEILETNRVEGRGEESLFALVDELSAAIRNHFEVRPPAAAAASVAAVTTSSMEAWRFYSEGLALAQQSKRREAIELMEKAVEIDPEFALALADLARLYDGVGEPGRFEAYSRRAAELADRLPLDQRYAVEAVHYASKWSTYDHAVEAYERALDLYPDRRPLRDNLALLYTDLERYDEALDEYETLIAEGASYPGTYSSAANAYAALGRFETGYRVLADFAREHPDNASTRLDLGWYLTEWGRWDEASEAIERAAATLVQDASLHYARWRLAVLREDWEAAEAEAGRLALSQSPFGRWRGAAARARNLTYRGRSAEALLAFDEAIAEAGAGGLAALTRCWKAELLLARGEAARARGEARRAREEGRERFPELLGIFFEALAEQELDRPEAADAAAEELARRAGSEPNRDVQRQILHLRGRLALARGNAVAASEALRRAADLLPPKGIESHLYIYPVHVPVWTALGEAERSRGRADEALGWLQRAAAGGSEHLEQPVPYVRSLHLLAEIHHQRGAADEARRFFERFLTLWQGGDLEPERLEAARRALDGL